MNWAASLFVIGLNWSPPALAVGSPNGLFAAGSSRVEIGRLDNEWTLTVQIIGQQKHECFYEGPARWGGWNELLSEAQNESPNGLSVCQIKIKYLDEDSLQLTSSGNCANYCAGPVRLELARATRI